MTKRWPELAGLTVLASLALAFGVPSGAAGEAPSGDTPTGRVLDVDGVTVRPETGYEVAQRYTGIVRARRDANLALESGGRVLAVHADVGETVAADQLLVELDVDLLTAQRAEIDGRLAAARAVLAELDAGPRVEVIDATRALRDQQRARVKLAELELERRRELVERAVDSQAQLDAAESELATAEALLRQSEAQLAELEEGTRPEVLDAQRARVTELEASLARLDVQIGDSRLTAPFAGVIAERGIDEGAVVATGTVVLRLVEASRLEAWIGVPPDVVESVLNAAELELRSDDADLTWTGKRLHPEVDQRTRTQAVIFELDPAHLDDSTLRPGALVRLGLRRRVESTGFWLPLEALVPSARGLWSCKTIEPDGQQDTQRIGRAEVEVLHTDGSRAFVRGTLRAGDRVVATGVQRVVAGQTVHDQGTDEDRR